MNLSPNQTYVVSYWYRYADCADVELRAAAFMNLSPNQTYVVSYWYRYADARLAREHLKDRAPKRTLDLACGTGLFSEQLCILGGQLTGVDLSEGMLAHASAKQLPNTEFRTGDFHDLQFAEDNSVDLVSMYAASRFISDPSRFFAEIARVLSSDGLVIISYFDSPRRVPQLEAGARSAGLRVAHRVEIPPSFVKPFWPLVRFNETTIRLLVT